LPLFLKNATENEGYRVKPGNEDFLQKALNFKKLERKGKI
jgi:hypothetical protein